MKIKKWLDEHIGVIFGIIVTIIVLWIGMYLPFDFGMSAIPQLPPYP